MTPPPDDVRSEGRRGPPGRGRRGRRPPPPGREASAGPRATAAPAGPLFSPPALFHALRAVVLPSLAGGGWPRIWVAGCGTGEEVWSLAICLEEAGLLSQSRIYATDADDVSFPRARQGWIDASALSASQHDYRASGGEGGLVRHLRLGARGASVLPALGERVVFGRHDAVRDAPFHLFDLVLWRASLGSARPDAVRVLDACCLPGGWLSFRPGEEPDPGTLARYVRPVPGVPLYRKDGA